MEKPTNITWTKRLERLLADEGEKALCMNWMHVQAEAMYSRRSASISIPVIVLSTLAGTASIGSSSLFGDSPFSSVGIGAVSIIVGILNTLGSYFAWAKRAEGHRISSQMFSKLNKFIMIELALPRKERVQPGEFVKFVKQEGDRLAETAPAIPAEIVRSFRSRFKKSTISKPNIANGMDPIEIFDESLTEGGGTLHRLLPSIPESTDESDETSTTASDSITTPVQAPRRMSSLFSVDKMDALKKAMEPEPFKIDPYLLDSIKKLAANSKVQEMIGKVKDNDTVKKVLEHQAIQSIVETVEHKLDETVPEEVKLVIREVSSPTKKNTEEE
jgi:hypothetical protein